MEAALNVPLGSIILYQFILCLNRLITASVAHKGCAMKNRENLYHPE